MKKEYKEKLTILQGMLDSYLQIADTSLYKASKDVRNRMCAYAYVVIRLIDQIYDLKGSVLEKEIDKIAVDDLERYPLSCYQQLKK